MNRRNTGRARLSAILAALVLTAGTGAASAGTYVGGSYSWADGGNSDFEDSTATGWRAFLGANASGVFGWELGYGEVSEFRGRTLGKLEVNAWDASLLVGLPAGPLTFFGRLGGVFGTVKTDNFSSDDWTYRYGLGLDVNLGKTVGLRFEWNRTPFKSDITDVDTDVDIDTASAGILFRF